MAAPKSGIAGMIGSSVGESAAFAAGLAIAPALEPLLQALRNETWPKYPDKPLEPTDAADVVAEGFITEATGAKEAGLTGLSATRFGHLAESARAGPAISEARELVRRKKLTTAQLHLAYRKAKIDPQWFAALDVLLDTPLPPAVAALAVVRGLIPSEGTLLVDPPNEAGRIPAYPQEDISGLDAAKAAGFSAEAFKVMVGINGRPMSLHEAASAYFRGIIELPDYYRAVSEGDTRNEWRDAILEQARQIITAHDWVELHLRGYIGADEMYAGTALHGMSREDTDRLFRVLGRPMTAHQITLGLARGASFNPIPGELPDPYEAAAHESNVKPSYYDLWIAAGKYSYPPLFQLNQLVKANAITADLAKDWATKSGYAPEVIDALYTFWQGEQAKSTAGGTKAKVYTYAQIHTAWSHNIFTDAQALSELESIGYPAARAQTLLQTWKAQSTASA
jgi:hypothetical protein